VTVRYNKKEIPTMYPNTEIYKTNIIGDLAAGIQNQ